jgi:hypothetical protein
MRIARRLFVIPLANNDHGKTTIVNALLSQGLGAPSPERKGARTLISPSGREIDAYVFVRSYQETEKSSYKSVAEALKANDSHWKRRELIIFPSHISDSEDDVREMIALAHQVGFDTVCAAVLLGTDRRSPIGDIWEMNWDERWTVPNPTQDDEDNRRAQLQALGRDLWWWISKALVP